ncbi:MAG: zinc ribbon domain-containing protein [Chloroflexi bacterium]|nr:zinc ribbon domain-containing protein [Chloroflexota bacterium]
MEQRIYHGTITPNDIARELVSYFNRGNFRVQQIGSGSQVAVQIATRDHPASGGQTALSVSIQDVSDGIQIQVGNQAWLGVAASLGMTALSALRNPFALIGRLDDLAQDIESLQLTEEIWSVIDGAARAAGAGHELSERLRRMECSYCGTANPVGEPNCIACGAPLGDVQPVTCKYCGFILKNNETACPNCGKLVA